MRRKMNREAMTLVQILAAFVFVSLAGLTMVTVSLADDGTPPQAVQAASAQSAQPGVPVTNGGQPPVVAATPVPNSPPLPPSLPPAGPLRSIGPPSVPATQALSTNTPVSAEVRRPSDKPVIYETSDGRKIEFPPGTQIIPTQPTRNVIILGPKVPGYEESMIWDGFERHAIMYEPIAKGKPGYVPPDKRPTFGRDGTITYPDGSTYNPRTGVQTLPLPRPSVGGN